MTDELKQEYTRRISQANPTELTVVIYDIALNYIDETEAVIRDKNADKRTLSDCNEHIRRCINELIGSLHYEYPIAGDLQRVYRYCLSLVSKITLNKDEAALAEIKNILIKLRDAYAQVAYLNGAGAVMSNSESVYAGLTYGRGTLNEDIVGTSNRGFLV